MMGVTLLMVMVVVAASAAEIYISDVVDVKIGDKGNELGILTLDNIESGADETEESFNFLISSPKHNPIDIASQEEIYLPDEDPIANTIDDTLGSDDIFDVVKNFISEKDAMLQLFLYICFLHPTCYQLDMPSTTTYSSSYISSSSQDMVDNLLARRTETARNILLDMIRDVQDKIKILMFKYIEKGVGERGVSLTATKSIIDSVKSIWRSVNSDLESSKSSIQELFYLLPLDTKEQVQAMVEIAKVVQVIPDWTEQLLEENYQQLEEN